MSLNYDEILSDNFFGQIIVSAPNSTKQSPTLTMTNTNEKKADEKEIQSLTEQYGFSIDDLFNMGRHFLKGKTNQIIYDDVSFFS